MLCSMSTSGMTTTIYRDLLCRANRGNLSTKGVELRGDKFKIYQYDLFYLMPFEIVSSSCRIWWWIVKDLGYVYHSILFIRCANGRNHTQFIVYRRNTSNDRWVEMLLFKVIHFSSQFSVKDDDRLMNNQGVSQSLLQAFAL